MSEHGLSTTVLNVATFLWLLGWAIHGARNLLSRERHSVSFLLVVQLLFCGVPRLLDELAGRPDFHLWPGFDAAAADGTANVLYCLYVSACPLLWWWCGRVKRRTLFAATGSSERLTRLSWFWKAALHGALISPMALLFFAPNPGLYTRYAAVVRDAFSPAEFSFHSTLAISTFTSAIAGAMLLLSQRNVKRTLCYAIPCALLAIWLDGKRAVALITLIMYVVALWSRGVIKRRTLVMLIPAAAAGFAFFSLYYQGRLRSMGELDSAAKYDNFRLDYGRDHVILLSLYSESNAEAPPILEYRMQSLIFDATMFVPREIWPEKPWPYAVYATAAAFRLPVRYSGWGVTTSWLAESVANMGWVGLLSGPLLLAWICRTGDRRNDPLVQLLTILVSALLLVVQLPAFLPLAVTWLLMLMATRRKRRVVALHPRAAWHLNPQIPYRSM